VPDARFARKCIVKEKLIEFDEPTVIYDVISGKYKGWQISEIYRLLGLGHSKKEAANNYKLERVKLWQI